MNLVPSFQEVVQPLAVVMTAPSFASFITLLAGWVFARRRTVTGMILAADAVGMKHHSSGSEKERSPITLRFLT